MTPPTGSRARWSASGAAKLSKRALIIVDYQCDFVWGSLAVPGAEEIRDTIRDLTFSGRYDIVAATQDWHPADHCSFVEQGGPWPVHCVRSTVGASIAGGLLQLVTPGWVFIKGDSRDVEEYSGAEARDYEGRWLTNRLEEEGVTEIDVVGLALDYCVKETAIELREADGFAVRVILDATRAVSPASGLSAIGQMRTKGVKIA